MDISKYYDPILDRPLTLEDGCSWEAWLAGAESRFSVHPYGFPVFVRADQLHVSDEYAGGDPYAVAKQLDSAFQQRRFQETLHLLSTVLPQSGAGFRILDLGCGEGHITDAIRQRWTEAQVCGFDYSLSAIEIAQRLYPSIEFAVADAYAIPYGPATIDVAVINNLWEHVPDPLRLASHVRRILKLGGYVIISTPSRYRFENLLRAVSGGPIVFMSKHHVTEYTVGQVFEQLRFGGFEAITLQSTRISAAEWSWKWRLAKACLSWWLRRVNSHHSLESTIFYLARKS
jgi:SAM-dependent methyltransferase